MLPADKTTEPIDEVALYQRCFERERRARQQAEAVLEAKSLDLYLKHEELLRVNETLEQRIEERTAELAAAVKQAEKASATKSEFLAKMSHEIRTPMNGVLGMLEALQLTALNDKQREYLKIAHDSADTLLALINDILDFSKIEAGRMSLESIHFDLQALLDNVLQLWQPRTLEKNLHLELQVDADVPRWLIGDPTRVSQILTNLVSNAIKFTSTGGITIQCDSLTPAGVDPAMLRFTVQDTGIGMSAQVCSRLFTAFEQAEGAATTRVYGGTGLGLAICKQLTQLMEGEITVESTPGAGSCFTVILPFKPGTAPAVKPDAAITAVTIQPAETHEQHHQVLVVDDNDTNRRVALAVLEHLGFITVIACDGAEAVQAVKSGKFSLVLMDCHMPLLDGFEATRAIRAWEQDNARKALPIIAVSASAFQEDRDRCAAVGMNDFLSKPVTLTSMQTMMQRWLPVHAAHDKPHGAIAASTLAAGKTLHEEYNNGHSNGLSNDVLDREQLLEMKLVTATQFNSLIERFFADSLLQIQGMRQAASNNDCEALRRCAHKLKGSSGSVGAKALSKRCHHMEERAKAGILDDVDEIISDINASLDEAATIIKEFTST